jgi:hypothetical protein
VVEINPSFRRKLHVVRELDDGKPALERTTCHDFNNGSIFGKDV